MSKKKIIWIIILVAFIIGVIFLVSRITPNNNQSQTTTVGAGKNTNISAQNNATTNTNTTNITNQTTNNQTQTTSSISRPTNETPAPVKSTTPYKKVELADGTLYTLTGSEVKADIVIGDNYFDTTITDMYLNSENYMNKNIQIEGMYLVNSPYTFVGRFSTSNMCAYCPTGYSYIEYQLDGTIDREFTDTEDWIKIIGTLQKGNDETSNFTDYYYLKVKTLEVMNERGQETVNN